MRFNLVVAALMLIASGFAQAATVAPPTPESAKVVGHLYMQSNTIANEIVHFARRADGTLAEVERVAMGDAGSGVFKPVSGQASAPNAFEGAGSVILAVGNRLLFATSFGYGSLASFALDGDALRILKDPANDPIPGDGTFRAVNGLVSSGPSDSWLSPDDAFLYQIFGNASTLIGYRLGKDGSLAEVSRHPIAYNSPQGLAGF